MNSSIESIPSNAAPTWKWVRIALGSLLLLLGVGQAYLMMSPALELLEFVPLGFLIQEMAPTLLLLHSYALAVIALIAGGILLALRVRLGHIFIFGACCLFLVTAIEVMVVTSQMQDASVKALLSEVLADTGKFFVVAHIMYVVALVLTNLKPARLELGIQRKQRLWAIGFAAFLILDFNITSAYLFL